MRDAGGTREGTDVSAGGDGPGPRGQPGCTDPRRHRERRRKGSPAAALGSLRLRTRAGLGAGHG